MVNIYDVNQDLLVKEISSQLKEDDKIEMPAWARFVKTGPHKERNPNFNDWWYFRAASILKKIYTQGPIGVAKLRTKYGGKKNRGLSPERFVKASGKIIRVILQQLESADYISKEEKTLHKGRKITPKGTSLVDKAAGNIFNSQKNSEDKAKNTDVKENKDTLKNNQTNEAK